jgi:hypothetical protein
MKRLISARNTFFYKIVLPAFLFTCTVVVPPVVYLADKQNNGVAAVFTGIFLLISALLIFVMTKGSKKLSIDNRFLYVSNYSKEIAVPFSEIDKILWTGDARPTLIYFKNKTGFGKRINFYPNITVASPRPNPLVEELKRLAGIPSR